MNDADRRRVAMIAHQARCSRTSERLVSAIEFGDRIGAGS